MKDRETRQSRKRRREELIAQATRERQEKAVGSEQIASRASGKSQAPISGTSAQGPGGNVTSKVRKLPD